MLGCCQSFKEKNRVGFSFWQTFALWPLFEKVCSLNFLQPASLVILFHIHRRIRLRCVKFSYILRKYLLWYVYSGVKQANHRLESRKATVHRGKLREAYQKPASCTTELVSDLGLGTGPALFTQLCKRAVQLFDFAAATLINAPWRHFLWSSTWTISINYVARYVFGKIVLSQPKLNFGTILFLTFNFSATWSYLKSQNFSFQFTFFGKIRRIA